MTESLGLKRAAFKVSASSTLVTKGNFYDLNFPVLTGLMGALE